MTGVPFRPMQIPRTAAATAARKEAALKRKIKEAIFLLTRHGHTVIRPDGVRLSRHEAAVAELTAERFTPTAKDPR